MNDKLSLLLLAMAPISELRGAIPFGLAKGVPLFQVILISILGNLLPVPFLYFGIEKLSSILSRFSLCRKFFNWLFVRTKRRARIIERYESLGLFLFVAIPLPFTGAWTGTIAASLFHLRFKWTIISVICGIGLAALVVTLLTLGVIKFMV